MTCLKEQARPAKNISQRGTRSATNWPVLQSLSLFVQISLPLLRAGQWLSVSQEQQRDSAASTQSAKCTCSWLFSPSVLVKKTNKAERSPDWSTLTHSHTSITRRLESLFIQPQTVGSRLRQRKYYFSTGGAYLSLLLSGFIWVPNMKRVNQRGLSSDLPSRRLGIFTASF